MDQHPHMEVEVEVEAMVHLHMEVEAMERHQQTVVHHQVKALLLLPHPLPQEVEDPTNLLPLRLQHQPLL